MERKVRSFSAQAERSAKRACHQLTGELVVDGAVRGEGLASATRWCYPPIP